MDAQIKIEKFAVGINQENAYIVHADGQSTAVCIDPGDEVEKITGFADQNNLTIAKILITHAHWDHINHVGKLKLASGARIYCHRADLFLYEKIDQQAAWMGGSAEPLPEVDHFISDGDIVEESKLQFKVFHTPGHSPGGVCYLIGNTCFVGDTIFAQSVGRSDLPGGDEQVLLQSIQAKILTLPDETILHPGHGPQTTVEQERRLNPFLQHL